MFTLRQKGCQRRTQHHIKPNWAIPQVRSLCGDNYSKYLYLSVVWKNLRTAWAVVHEVAAELTVTITGCVRHRQILLTIASHTNPK